MCDVVSEIMRRNQEINLTNQSTLSTRPSLRHASEPPRASTTPVIQWFWLSYGPGFDPYAQHHASNPHLSTYRAESGGSGQQTSILPEGQGHAVNMRLVLVVEQIIVGESCDVQSQIQHMGLEVFV